MQEVSQIDFVHVPDLHEMASFPKGKYDDQADSTSQALDWFKEQSMAAVYATPAELKTTDRAGVPVCRLTPRGWIRCSNSEK